MSRRAASLERRRERGPRTGCGRGSWRGGRRVYGGQAQRAQGRQRQREHAPAGQWQVCLPYNASIGTMSWVLLLMGSHAD